MPYGYYDVLGQIGVVGYIECSQLYISCGALSSSLSSPLHHPLLHRRIAPISANATYAKTSMPPPCGSSHIACIPVSPHTHVRPGAILLVLLVVQCQYSGLASIQTQQPLQGSPQSFNSNDVVVQHLGQGEEVCDRIAVGTAGREEGYR